MILTEGVFIEYQPRVRGTVGDRGGSGVGGSRPTPACPPSVLVSELQTGEPATTAQRQDCFGVGRPEGDPTHLP